jgi:uncharacterized protein CbrC (UPF0167 family)
VSVAIEALRPEHDEYNWPREDVDEYLAAPDKDWQPISSRRHCGQPLAYSDFT